MLIGDVIFLFWRLKIKPNCEKPCEKQPHSRARKFTR